jgi:hypothetical protein
MCAQPPHCEGLGNTAWHCPFRARRGTRCRDGAIGAFNIFNSILAGIAVFIGGFAFGYWATNSDPAFLRIIARSEKYKLRYDAAKQQIPRVEVH